MRHTPTWASVTCRDPNRNQENTATHLGTVTVALRACAPRPRTASARATPPTRGSPARHTGLDQTGIQLFVLRSELSRPKKFGAFEKDMNFWRGVQLPRLSRPLYRAHVLSSGSRPGLSSVRFVRVSACRRGPAVREAKQTQSIKADRNQSGKTCTSQLEVLCYRTAVILARSLPRVARRMTSATKGRKLTSPVSGRIVEWNPVDRSSAVLLSSLRCTSAQSCSSKTEKKE